MKDFCILGSGIAGSTIANLLSKKYSVEIFDKARGPGGRVSNRRFKKNLNFDHGAQYFYPKNTKFKNFLNSLKKKNIVKYWPGEHVNFKKLKTKQKSKFIGVKGNNDINKYLLKKIKTNFLSKIKRINYDKKVWEICLENGKKINFRNLIITIPYPQLKILAKKFLNRSLLDLNVKMSPNITFMVAYKNQPILPFSSIKFNDKIISWAASENSKKRFKSNLSLWTIQTTDEYSRKYINNYKIKNKFITKDILNRLALLLNFDKKNIIFSNIHGWKYSYNLKPTKLNSFFSNKLNLGICGDWFMGSKVEHAWLSAHDLYKKIYKF